jgi:hypothetical protein
LPASPRGYPSLPSGGPRQEWEVGAPTTSRRGRRGAASPRQRGGGGRRQIFELRVASGHGGPAGVQLVGMEAQRWRSADGGAGAGWWTLADGGAGAGWWTLADRRGG